MGKIAVTKSSISESFAHSSYDAKLNVVPFLKELLETSVYAGTLPDFHGKDEQNYYFVSRIQQECKDKLVFFRIKEKSNRGKSFYVHDIYTEDQIKNQRSSNQVRSQEGMVEPESVGLAERLLREIYSVNSSVVVSENGEPRIMCQGKGFSFTQNLLFATCSLTDGSSPNGKGEKSCGAFLNIRKPLFVNSDSPNGREDNDTLKEKGFDGIIVSMPDKRKEGKDPGDYRI